MGFSDFWIHKVKERWGDVYAIALRVPYNPDFKTLPVITTITLQNSENELRNLSDLQDSEKEFHTLISGLSKDQLEDLYFIIGKALSTENTVELD